MWTGGMWMSSKEDMVAPGHHQVNVMGHMEVVSKTCVYFRVKMSVNELLVILKLIFFVATMIGDIIEGDTIYPQIHCQILRSTHMVQRTPGPSLIEVSDVVIKESGVNGLCILGMVTTMVKDNDFTHCCVY